MFDNGHSSSVVFCTINIAFLKISMILTSVISREQKCCCATFFYAFTSVAMQRQLPFVLWFLIGDVFLPTMATGGMKVDGFSLWAISISFANSRLAHEKSLFWTSTNTDQKGDTFVISQKVIVSWQLNHDNMHSTVKRRPEFFTLKSYWSTLRNKNIPSATRPLAFWYHSKVNCSASYNYIVL